MIRNENILPDSIRSILTKYYNGLTSIEEEKVLREYFKANLIPESNLSDKAILSFNNDEKISIFPTNEIWEKLRTADEQANRRRKTIRLSLSIAASVVIVFSLSLGYTFLTMKQNKLIADSYKNPEEAYRAVQKYLGLVSSKLSYAYTEMQPIEKLSIPNEAMQSFSSINENFQYLNRLETMGTATRELERFSIISDILVDDKN